MSGKKSNDNDEEKSKIKTSCCESKERTDSKRKEVIQCKAEGFRILCWGKSSVSVHENPSPCLQQAQRIREKLESVWSEKDACLLLWRSSSKEQKTIRYLSNIGSWLLCLFIHPASAPAMGFQGYQDSCFFVLNPWSICDPFMDGY